MLATKHYENMPVSLASRLSLRLSAVNNCIMQNCKKIPLLLIGDVNRVSENEAGPSGRAVKGVGLRPLAR